MNTNPEVWSHGSRQKFGAADAALESPGYLRRSRNAVACRAGQTERFLLAQSAPVTLMRAQEGRYEDTFQSNVDWP